MFIAMLALLFKWLGRAQITTDQRTEFKKKVWISEIVMWQSMSHWTDKTILLERHQYLWGLLLYTDIYTYFLYIDIYTNANIYGLALKWYQY